MILACQALAFRRPLQSSPIVEAAHAWVRQYISFATEDRIFAKDIEMMKEKLFAFLQYCNTVIKEKTIHCSDGFEAFYLT